MTPSASSVIVSSICLYEFRNCEDCNEQDIKEPESDSCDEAVLAPLCCFLTLLESDVITSCDVCVVDCSCIHDGRNA